MVRIAENNDWVIITLLLCGFVYILMFIFLLRNISLKTFMMQEYIDSSNNFLTWVITSVVFCTVSSVLISQYIPIVPKKAADLPLFGLELNKFGYTFICISIFFLLKTSLAYLFYSGIDNIRKWSRYYFTATKFYLGGSILVGILCVVHYYFDIDRQKALRIYFVLFAFLFVFKIFFYFLHKNQILPEKWYYKILYICTLQIVPLLALWRLLFF
ncbi:MAG: DUF4271 domain-containing protein [Bergeyella sp.]